MQSTMGREEFLGKVLIATLVPFSLNIGKTVHIPKVFERSYNSKIFNSYEILKIFWFCSIVHCILLHSYNNCYKHKATKSTCYKQTANYYNSNNWNSKTKMLKKPQKFLGGVKQNVIPFHRWSNRNKRIVDVKQ